MRRVVFRPKASRDLDEIVVRISEDSPISAERFVQAVQATAEWLANFPGAGHRVDCGGSKPDPRRQFGVRGFRKYLVFYRHTKTQLLVVRVIHGARDLPNVLRDERD